MRNNSLKNFTGRNVVAAFIGVLGILGAQREKAWANDIAFLETIYNTDFAAAAVGGLRDSSTAMMRLSGISGTVDKAYLYWHGPMNSTNPLANATIVVNHRPVTGVNIGYSDDNCWGFDNSQAYRADVTSLVRAERNGTYFLSDFVKQGTNINANGASMLVFFNDGKTNNNRDIVLFDGNDSNADNFYDAPGWNVVLEGITYSSGKGFIQLHVSDGQIYEDADVLLNGHVLEQRGQVFQGATVMAANNGPSGTGRLWDVKAYDITPILAAGSNTVSITHAYLGTSDRLKGDCISLVVAAMNLPAGSAPPLPPANIAPVVIGVPEVTVNSPNAIALQAQVSDQDGNPLTYTIAMDGAVVLNGGIPAGSPVTTGTLDISHAFSLGQHTVVFTANDGFANGSFTTVVNVIDNTPPVLNVPENITVPSAPGQTNAVVNYLVTASDDFPGVTVISLPPSGSKFPIGVTTVTATAVDASGNRTQKTFTITVTDCLPPTVNCPGDMLRATDPGTSNVVVHFTVTAHDNMPGVSAPTCNPASGSTFQLGITAVNCSARDAKGNSGSCMFFVTVVDREPPVVTVPANITLTADSGQNTKVATFTVSVRDNVPGAVVVCVPPSGAAFPIGVTRVTCIGSDVGGNHATNSFTVTCNAADNAGNATSGGFTVTVTNTVVEPPDFGCVTPSTSVIWPGNHQMVPVSLWLNFDKKKVKFSSIRIVSVTSNEPETGLWKDDIGPDWEILKGKQLKLNLRAERDDKGNGRIYTITVEGKDKQGNLYLCKTTVTVPQGRAAQKWKR